MAKKQAKKEQLDRKQAEIDRYKNIIVFIDILNAFGNESVKKLFRTGSSGALVGVEHIYHNHYYRSVLTFLLCDHYCFVEIVRG